MADDAPAESLQVSEELEAEFESALQYQLTDEDIERARLLLGVDTASRERELYSVATPDAIRNWALGVGDDNPLYTDEDVRPGHPVGHPDRARHDDRATSRRRCSATRSPTRSSSRPRACSAASTCSCPAARGTGTGRSARATASTRSRGEETLDVKQSEFAGRSVGAGAPRRRAQPARRGARRLPHPAGADRAQGVARRRASTRRSSRRTTPTTTTSASTRSTRRSAPRGAEKRYWEDVEVGDELPPMVKGPLTVTEMIAFHAGGYGFVPYGLRVVARRLQEPPADRAVLHQERAGRLGRRPAPALGLAVGEGDRQPDGLRLRRAAPVLVLPPRLRLGRRRRLHRADRATRSASSTTWATRSSSPARSSPSASEDGRHLVDLEAAHGEPARHRDRLRHRDRRRCRRGTAGLPPLPAVPVDLRAPGSDDVRPPQRAEGAAGRSPVT